MAASQSCNTSMPENFRNIYGNIVSIGKGIALIAMRFVVAQVQQFVGFFFYIFFLGNRKHLNQCGEPKEVSFLIYKRYAYFAGRSSSGLLTNQRLRLLTSE